MCLGRLAAVGLAVTLAGTSAFSIEDPSEAERVERLVLQLGSAEYAERESAERELDGMGPQALESLRRGSRSEDPEVRRRAEALVQQIERRAEAAKLLAPRTVRLAYRDVAVSDALTDFSQKTGFSLQLGDARRGPVKGHRINRKMSLETGELSFWEAFDRFCRAAGLMEAHLLPAAADTPQNREAAVQELQVRLRGQQVLISSEEMRMARNAGAMLIEGEPPRLPTCVTGPFRIRALPAKPGRDVPPEEIELALEVTADPKLTWFYLGNLCIDRAIDENDQPLTPVFAVGGQGGAHAIEELLLREAGGQGLSGSSER
jgi:hypothetical protein